MKINDIKNKINENKKETHTESTNPRIEIETSNPRLGRQTQMNHRERK